MDATVNSEPDAASALPHAAREIFRRRRSVYAYLDQDVPRAVLEQAMLDACHAPNHHRTSPWRFFVIPREARAALASAYAAAARRTGRDEARAVQRASDAPVNIVVACVPAVGNPRVVPDEEVFATAAAVQNLLLSLAAAGVDTLLTTGELAQSPEVGALVGLADAPARLLGVINVGYRNPQRPVPPRPAIDLARVASWIGGH